jgi:hypothetical protein
LLATVGLHHPQLRRAVRPRRVDNLAVRRPAQPEQAISPALRKRYRQRAPEGPLATIQIAEVCSFRTVSRFESCVTVTPT